MPGGDRTGPMGLGPRTGRAAGWCAGFGAPGYMNQFTGGGSGRGVWQSRGFRGGGGFGWRHWYYATGLPGWAQQGRVPAFTTPFRQDFSKEQELEALKAQADYFKESLDSINKRLDELKAATDESK